MPNHRRNGPISIKVNPLSMGDREDPARLVFTSKNRSYYCNISDRSWRSFPSDHQRCRLQEDRKRDAETAAEATAFWTPQPDLATGAEAWILAGGAHHTAFSYDITAEQMGDWAEAMGIEAVYIDKDTQIRNFKNELKWNSMYYKLNK